MDIIDAQLHDIGPRLAWKDADLSLRFNVLTELMLAWMDAVGVARALIHPHAADWARLAISDHCDRFAGVYNVRDAEAADVSDQVAELMTWPNAVGGRLSFGKLRADPEGKIGPAKVKAGVFDAFFAACQKACLPLFCSAYGFPHVVGEIAAAHLDLSVIVDHMGIAQPPLNPRETPSWKSLEGLLKVAVHKNIAVKMCGVPVLSGERFPFRDVWPHVHRMLQAFGPERLMWASDIGRFTGRISWDNLHPRAHQDYPGKHTYAEAVLFLSSTDQLSGSEKTALMGGNVRRLLRWPR